MTSKTILDLVRFNPEFTADAVEWCPISPYQNCVTLALYQLQSASSPDCDNPENSNGDTRIEKTGGKNQVGDFSSPEVNVPQKRCGRIQTFSLTSLDGVVSLDLKHTLDTPGIFDVKWCPHRLGDSVILGAADADGKVDFKCLKPVDQDIVFEEVEAAEVGIGCMALSLDWSNRVSKCQEPNVVVSDSAGNISLVNLCHSDARVEKQWKAHDFEAWISAFDYWNPSIIFSGGDDCKLKGWDLRTDCTFPTFSSRKHEMGVCSIQCNPVKEHLVATGSYDENVLIWDTRKTKRPLSETPTGGGVWRIKWHPVTGELILTASMHNGVHILDCRDINCDGAQPLLASYMEHKSMAYGADWCPLLVQELPKKTDFAPGMFSAESSSLKLDKNATIIASCSFYDKLFSVWAWQSES